MSTEQDTTAARLACKTTITIPPRPGSAGGSSAIDIISSSTTLTRRFPEDQWRTLELVRPLALVKTAVHPHTGVADSIGASRLSIGSLDKADFDAGDEDEEAEAEAEADGWNGFKWGFGRLSTWGFGANGGSGPGGDDLGSGSCGDSPHTDSTWNFVEEAIDSSSSDPEGTAEMKLEEDQIVRVVKRGRGKDKPEAAAADDTGFEVERPALAPDSYLELVKLDSEDQNERKLGAGAWPGRQMLVHTAHTYLAHLTDIWMLS
ncbi:hypothetical protein FIBSPDRAFT_928882 [Athelia psychrophila]|uniref:Uncharacterized protein n=1 Tax=Athelia psychrophila TaxID=1759441 RepID=A0A166PLH2_9AGAM|nr:hypothetical protein FIBSPDRAFT_928882 [Fibularhizoctonia sp. CBS 109695]